VSRREREPVERESLTAGDWYRYAGLLGLATLVLLVIVGQYTGGVAVLFAVYLLVATVVLLVLQVRRSRS
jgi:Flp pilus assembly protein TadB